MYVWKVNQGSAILREQETETFVKMIYLESNLKL